MNIQIIAVGKIREKYLQLGIDEFLKRISPYSSIKIIEIPAEILKAEELEEKAKEIEAQKILNVIKDNSFLITMEIKGKKFSSEEFAQKIKELNHGGYNNICFAIGGSNGLHKSVSDRANLKTSLSDMTFTHQLARFLILEQIYRAFKIINNEPYHK